MGWSRAEYVIPSTSLVKLKPDAPEFAHIEHLDRPVAPNPANPPTKTKARSRTARKPTSDLLFIASDGRDPVDEDDLDVYSPEEVATHSTVESGLWIIVEDRIYDCTHFVDIHPGGREVFAQFGGKQCTWQFWKWHNKRHLEEWSGALLIGRVSRIPPNPYKEPPRWIKTS